jgi:membrane protein YqaA with SNARE-associated domain
VAIARPSRITLLRILALILVIAMSIAIFTIPEEQARRLENYGYAGIFLLTMLAYGTLFLPAPVVIVIFSMAARLPPLGVALAAASGASIGELSGYLAGFSGQAVIENSRVYQKMVAWMQRFGGFTVLFLAAVPNPLFDFSGIAAGALRMPVGHFLIWCWLGQIIKMLVVAFAGAGLLHIPWFNN